MSLQGTDRDTTPVKQVEARSAQRVLGVMRSTLARDALDFLNWLICLPAGLKTRQNAPSMEFRRGGKASLSLSSPGFDPRPFYLFY